MGWFREWLDGDGDAASRAPAHRGSDPAPDADPAAAAGRRGPGPGNRPGDTERTGGPGAGPADEDPGHPGKRFGLPESGPGSVATLARRGTQFLLDAVLAGLMAATFTYPELPRNWSLLSWAILLVLPLAVVGVTPAMVLLGMRVVRLDRPDSPGIGPLWALVRTVSVAFVIPALLIDRDSRGIHDRASRTVVVRTR